MTDIDSYYHLDRVNINRAGWKCRAGQPISTESLDETTNSFSEIAIAGGFLLLVANGPGALALDNRNDS